MSDHKLIGHETYLEKFVTLYENNELPNKILLSGKKGIGKSLLAKKFLYRIFHRQDLSIASSAILNLSQSNYVHKHLTLLQP